MSDELTDEQLVERTLEGDMNAFGILVNRYRSLIHGLAYHVLGDFQDAEDIVQEAFIKAYNSLSILKDKAKFGSWLRVMALNLCKMWLRKSTKELPPAMDIPGEDIYIDEELQESVLAALSALPPKNQIVLTLFYLDDLSYKEIGDFLNLPISTVQSRLQRARKQLKGEFLKMAEGIFHNNKLGPEFTQKMLDEIMTEGRKYLDNEEWSEAEAAFLKTVDIKPDHAEAYFCMGLIKENQDLYDEAAEWYQKSAELKPDYALAYVNLARSAHAAGKSDEAQIAYDKAIAAYKKLLELNPDDPELHKQLGEAYTGKGDSKNGIAALKHAITLKPDYFEAYAYLGYAHEVDGNIEEAKRIYKQTTELEVDPNRLNNNPEAYRICMAYNNLGSLYDREGEYDKAILCIQKAIEKAEELGVTKKYLQTNLAVVYANKGSALATKGKYADAVTAYKKALNMLDELKLLIGRPSNYIKQRFETGRDSDIIHAFEDFLVRDPEDAESYYGLARLYSAKGNNDRASEALSRAIALDSSYHEKAKTSKLLGTSGIENL